MRNILKGVYKALPLPDKFKQRLKSAMPYALQQPNPALRRHGTIDDLYPWRIDDGFDTRLFVQNYFSFFFPALNTATSLSLWLNDEGGRELARRSLPLGRMATADISLREWVSEIGRPEVRGTLMWHVSPPPDISAFSEPRHAYFTDRGYIAFIKDGVQPSFMHGVDRYAVFHERDPEPTDRYYPEGRAYEWRPEIPLGPSLGCLALEVLTVNRSDRPVEIELRVLDGDKEIVDSRRRLVPGRGLFHERLEAELLVRLADRGSLHALGLPTPWSRVMILRRCPGGSASPMHC
jgi:hypothetical protein